ncbi:MAG: hypothetical protein D6690_14255 [Nitrospirae bacterium]|nr:MAG: hypothetical protein D6690_14255 [Nitrospirota bacterium]
MHTYSLWISRWKGLGLGILLLILTEGSTVHDAAGQERACSIVEAEYLTWLANASTVNFGDLIETIELAPPREESWKQRVLRWRYGPDVYEGFFEQYKEQMVAVPLAVSGRTCLTAEAEWVLVFSDPRVAMEQMARGQWESVRVELRGMIEGKRLEHLTAETCPPNWRAASQDNNVVTDGGLGPYSLGEMECRILCEEAPCPAELGTCTPLEGRIDILANDQRIFWSDIEDLGRFLRRIPGAHPLVTLVQQVYTAYRAHVPESDTPDLKAIDFGAAGAYAALVNDDARRVRAEAALGWTRFFRAMWDPCLKARVMEQLAIAALEEPAQPYCLRNGSFLLTIAGTPYTATLMGQLAVSLNVAPSLPASAPISWFVNAEAQ